MNEDNKRNPYLEIINILRPIRSGLHENKGDVYECGLNY